LTPEEKVEARRQLTAKLLGIKEIPKRKEPSKHPEGQGQGQVWVSKDGRTSFTRDPDGKVRKLGNVGMDETKLWDLAIKSATGEEGKVDLVRAQEIFEIMRKTGGVGQFSGDAQRPKELGSVVPISKDETIRRIQERYQQTGDPEAKRALEELGVDPGGMGQLPPKPGVPGGAAAMTSPSLADVQPTGASAGGAPIQPFSPLPSSRQPTQMEPPAQGEVQLPPKPDGGDGYMGQLMSERTLTYEEFREQSFTPARKTAGSFDLLGRPVKPKIITEKKAYENYLEDKKAVKTQGRFAVVPKGFRAQVKAKVKAIRKQMDRAKTGKAKQAAMEKLNKLREEWPELFTESTIG